MFTVRTSTRLINSTYDFYHQNTEGGRVSLDFESDLPPTSQDSGMMPFVHRNVTCRARNLGAIVVSPVAGAVDLALGSLAVVGSVFTGGKVQALNDFAYKQTFEGGLLLPNTYAGLIRTINPRAKINDMRDPGFLNSFGAYILKAAHQLSYHDNVLMRHVVSRITYVAFILFSIVSRIVDLVIGILATLASLATGGRYKGINSIAYHGMSITLIVNDIYIGVVKAVNPWTDLPGVRNENRGDYERREPFVVVQQPRIQEEIVYIPGTQWVGVSPSPTGRAAYVDL